MMRAPSFHILDQDAVQVATSAPGVASSVRNASAGDYFLSVDGICVAGCSLSEVIVPVKRCCGTTRSKGHHTVSEGIHTLQDAHNKCIEGGTRAFLSNVDSCSCPRVLTLHSAFESRDTMASVGLTFLESVSGWPHSLWNWVELKMTTQRIYLMRAPIPVRLLPSPRQSPLLLWVVITITGYLV